MQTEIDSRIISLIYSILFFDIEEYKDVYMVEVKKGSIEENLLSGDFIYHVAPHQYKNVAEHLYDPEWMVFHKEDKIFQNIDSNRVKMLLKEIIKEKEKS